VSSGRVLLICGCACTRAVVDEPCQVRNSHAHGPAKLSDLPILLLQTKVAA
jgi:hypothetical protein